jgi:acyl carrier protein
MRTICKTQVGEENRMGEMTGEEQSLARLIVDVLNLEDVRPEDIEPDQPLFDGGLGLDSIDALEIAVALAQTYGVHLKAEDEETKSIFATLRSLSTYVTQQSNAQAG